MDQSCGSLDALFWVVIPSHPPFRGTAPALRCIAWQPRFHVPPPRGRDLGSKNHVLGDPVFPEPGAGKWPQGDLFHITETSILFHNVSHHHNKYLLEIVFPVVGRCETLGHRNQPLKTHDNPLRPLCRQAALCQCPNSEPSHLDALARIQVSKWKDLTL